MLPKKSERRRTMERVRVGGLWDWMESRNNNFSLNFIIEKFSIQFEKEFSERLVFSIRLFDSFQMNFMKTKQTCPMITKFDYASVLFLLNDDGFLKI